jgi:phage terminase large subunit
MAWLLYDIDKPRYRALVIRRNADDLKDWTDRAKHMYAAVGVTVTGKPSEFKFPSGAIIRTGHLKDEDAYSKYQGHEYQKILIEELTQIESEKNYEKLLASCRSSIPEIKPQVFLTTNPDPGTPGHRWVKRRFIDVSPAGMPYIDKRNGLSRIFIPAKVSDNPKLIEADPTYTTRLESIQDERLRKAWLDGVWEDAEVEGAYYSRLMSQAMEDNRIGFVAYEPKLLVNTYWDLGIGDYMSIVFIQIIGKEVRVIDFYQNSGEGIPHYIKVLKDKGYIYGEHYAPHDIEVRELTNGKTRRETAQNLGINFKVVPRLSREDGIEAVRNILPRCFFDQNKCENLIEALHNYRKKWDEKNQVFGEPIHDLFSHPADAFRMFAIAFKERTIDKSKYYTESVPINTLTNF